MIMLGLESSCDETAVALLQAEGDSVRTLSSQVYTQHKEHLDYGGVVPEIAARAHLEKFPPLIAAALKEAKLTYADVDAIAACTGPGLNGGLMMAMMFGKSLALGLDKPFYATNHLEGHTLMARLSEKLDFPFLMLLVSGGHCQFIAAEALGQYRIIGGTIDDAIGECFDKTARLMGLGYPGGTAVEKLAKLGNPKAFNLPLPLRHEGIDFSFSGLKTAVRTLVEKHQPLTDEVKADICASLQLAIGKLLAIKSLRALETTGMKQLVLSGGVAANQALRTQLTEACASVGATFFAPPISLCTDNAVMIAYAALLRAQKGHQGDNLDVNIRVRWPVEDLCL
jgi:N6-L-threonylcarbamoyladenine synthase